MQYSLSLINKIKYTIYRIFLKYYQKTTILIMKFKTNKTKHNNKSKHIRHDTQLKTKNKISKKNKLEVEQVPQYEQQIVANNDEEEITWKENIVENQDEEQPQQVLDQNNGDNEEFVSQGQGRQEDDALVGEQNVEQDLMAHNQRNLEEYQEEIGHRGVVYMSRIPPYMTPNFIRKLLQAYDVERIYLLPENQWSRNNRIKHGGSKRICFREGWIEFTDKKVAKNTALALNGQKMVHKKGSFYSEDIWNLKYLPKFKWHHLTQKLAHEQRLKKQRLRLQMQQQRKLQQHYTNQVHKSKLISGIIKGKLAKGKQLKNSSGRSFGQTTTLRQEDD